MQNHFFPGIITSDLYFLVLFRSRFESFIGVVIEIALDEYNRGSLIA